MYRRHQCHRLWAGSRIFFINLLLSLVAALSLFCICLIFVVVAVEGNEIEIAHTPHCASASQSMRFCLTLYFLRCEFSSVFLIFTVLYSVHIYMHQYAIYTSVSYANIYLQNDAVLSLAIFIFFACVGILLVAFAAHHS